MLYSNEASVKILKTVIMIAGFICIIAMTVLIFFQLFMILAVLTGFFIAGLIIVSVLNFQYIHIGEKGNKLIVRFYSIFSVDRNYQSIEIPFEHLRNIRVSKLFLGLKWDLKFIVRIRQGFAEYPPLSLSAVSFKDRKDLIAKLKLLISSANSTN